MADNATNPSNESTDPLLAVQNFVNEQANNAAILSAAAKLYLERDSYTHTYNIRNGRNGAVTAESVDALNESENALKQASEGDVTALSSPDRQALFNWFNNPKNQIVDPTHWKSERIISERIENLGHSDIFQTLRNANAQIADLKSTTYSEAALSESPLLMQSVALLYNERGIFEDNWYEKVTIDVHDLTFFDDNPSLMHAVAAGNIDALNTEQRMEMVDWALRTGSFAEHNMMGGIVTAKLFGDELSLNAKEAMINIQAADGMAKGTWVRDAVNIASDPTMLLGVGTVKAGAHLTMRAVTKEIAEEAVEVVAKEVAERATVSRAATNIVPFRAPVASTAQINAPSTIVTEAITGTATTSSITETLKAGSRNVATFAGFSALGTVAFAEEEAQAQTITTQPGGNNTMAQMTQAEQDLIGFLDKALFNNSQFPATADRIKKFYEGGQINEHKDRLTQAYEAIDAKKGPDGTIDPIVLQHNPLSEFETALYNFERQTALRINAEGVVPTPAEQKVDSKATVTDEENSETPVVAGAGTGTGTGTGTGAEESSKKKEEEVKGDETTKDPEKSTKDGANDDTEKEQSPQEKLEALLDGTLKTQTKAIDGLFQQGEDQAQKLIDDNEISELVKTRVGNALTVLTEQRENWNNRIDAFTQDAKNAIKNGDIAEIERYISQIDGKNFPQSLVTGQAGNQATIIESAFKEAYPGIWDKSSDMFFSVIDAGFLGNNANTSEAGYVIKNAGYFGLGVAKETGSWLVEQFKATNQPDSFGGWGQIAWQVAGALGVGLLLKSTVLDNTVGKIPFVGGLLSAGIAIVGGLAIGTGVVAKAQERYADNPDVASRLKALAATTVDENKKTEIITNVGQTSSGGLHLDKSLIGHAMATENSHSPISANDNHQVYMLHNSFKMSGSDSIKLALGGNNKLLTADNTNSLTDPNNRAEEFQAAVP